MARKVATVFGGSGFVGRSVVGRLARAGYVVRVAGRTAAHAATLRMLGDVGQVVPVVASVTDEAACVAAIEGSTLVINLVGVLSPHGAATFEAIHVAGAARIARISAAAGVERLIHVSAIGADVNSPSAYARSKGEGEAAVSRHMPQAIIIRPSLIFGVEGAIPAMFARMARFMPVVPVFGPATRFQPVWVGDVAEGMLRIATSEGMEGAIFEFGGPVVMTMRQLVAWAARWGGHPRPLIAVPRWLATLQASVLEHLPGKMLTRDQVKLLYVDNVVAPGARTLEMLGITPSPMDLVLD
ncbi:complex I NDUFA9 subunit family protein [Komagataeibacter sp. AV436]|uniref:Complex I NDUFA9 subunit family protein n=1 Tax=Komagataeibacter melomenusus TaxID=2766578 RepID=A0ABX2AGR8_9PROT|nr:complex I NDUFA9 subunit family protein [Komagataeibacter melomenusus]MBV1831848.1 complex I NDUFA9 subunit family protein [Komagataeibacter melomenusus]NPC67571.1 complex I NDUFA9 subunit family protein [Komagataeibacter melomenusus]